MPDTYLEATEESAIALFSRGITGPVVMLNLLRFRDRADYSADRAIAPAAPVSGREAFQSYIDHTLPYLAASGGEVSFLGNGGRYFIGPGDERWDLAMLIRQSSLESFIAFATNEAYLAGIGHRTAAVEDSRLLALQECAGNNILQAQG
jgi:hypothetical protein